MGSIMCDSIFYWKILIFFEIEIIIIDYKIYVILFFLNLMIYISDFDWLEIYLELYRGKKLLVLLYF